MATTPKGVHDSDVLANAFVSRSSFLRASAISFDLQKQEHQPANQRRQARELTPRPTWSPNSASATTPALQDSQRPSPP